MKGLDFISVTMGCHWRVFKQEQCVLICVVGGSLWLQLEGGPWRDQRREKDASWEVRWWWFLGVKR